MKLACITPGLVDYTAALAWQQTLVEQRIAAEIPDSLVLLEHPPVFTLGRGGDERYLLNPGQVPVHRVGRGGEVTFHGPGQLIGYPILDLKQNGKDVHRYLRLLEDVVIATLAAWGITATRRDGLTGVWVGTDKIASIGIGVRRWVAFHGFALNVNTDLSYFSAIVPCGLPGVHMTSMQELLKEELPLDTVQSAMVRSFARTFGHQEIVWNTSLQAPVLKPPPTERLATGP